MSNLEKIGKIVDFINSFKTENGRMPTQAEIARGLNMTRQNVRYHFDTILSKYGDDPNYKAYKTYTNKNSKKRIDKLQQHAKLAQDFFGDNNN